MLFRSGVAIDEKLSFRDHIHDKVHKAYAMLGIIKRNFNYISINSFILPYKSMVRSLLDTVSQYGYLIERETLRKVQKRKFRRRQPRLFLK